MNLKIFIGVSINVNLVVIENFCFEEKITWQQSLRMQQIFNEIRDSLNPRKIIFFVSPEIEAYVKYFSSFFEETEKKIIKRDPFILFPSKKTKIIISKQKCREIYKKKATIKYNFPKFQIIEP